MSKTIDELLAVLVQREGGYVNNPADRGGPTKFGITEQVARSEGYAGDMRDLSVEMAKNIYRRLYWDRPGFSQVALTMPRLAAEMFDTGVNMGPKRATIFLQRVLNVLNRSAADYPDIVVDGDLGNLTLQAMTGLAKKRPDAEALLIRSVDYLRGAAYIGIAEATPSQETFEYGWLERVGSAAA